jgi:glycosyltransferase involved in cell wall biosynthesis
MSNLKEKILTKSGSYKYYKDNFDKINKQNNSLIKSNKKLKDELDVSKNEISRLNKKLDKISKQLIIYKLINEEYSDLTIAIKSANPIGEHHWGDYFFSLALKRSFEKKGFNVVIQERENWYDKEIKADINLVLRGLVEYKPNSDEINIMWNISHPDMVKTEEYEMYDINFISSAKYAEMLDEKVNATVKPLLQCTDPEVFYCEPDDSIAEDILFVGVTRGVYREIVRDVMSTDYDVSIYGMEWENFVDEKYIKGEFIANDELHKYYSSCKILLNDHWEDMRDWDFPSNRLFDALACGTFVISDKIPSAETLFEGNIVTYEGVEDLNNKIEYYLTNENERKQKAQKGKQIVLKNHTFDNRVNTILDSLKNFRLE